MNEPSPPLAEASDMQLVTTRFASLAPLPGYRPAEQPIAASCLKHQ